MKPIFNRAPLTPNSRAALSLGHIEPEGWLKEQLRAQADGLSGKLFDIWPDVGENCGWAAMATRGSAPPIIWMAWCPSPGCSATSA